MSPRSVVGTATRWLATVAGVAAAAYGTYVGVTWIRYGRPSPPNRDEEDPLLDGFMPIYEVAERHHVRVGAPAAVTLEAAQDMDLQGSLVARTIIRAREVILGAARDDRVRPRGLIAEVQALGWGVLAHVPEREFVVGAITKPWEPNVTFRALSPDQFVGFAEPGFVKIVWTLRVVPIGVSESIFQTETRVVATDAEARRKFRRYWSLLSPGIILIRRAMLGPLKREAERRARRAAA